MESLIVSMPVTTTIEFLHPLRGTGHTRPGGMTTGARMVMTAEFQSTLENRALTRDPFSFKVWLTGTEHTEMATIEITRPTVGCMFQVPSVAAEPSEQQ